MLVTNARFLSGSGILLKKNKSQLTAAKTFQTLLAEKEKKAKETEQYIPPFQLSSAHKFRNQVISYIIPSYVAIGLYHFFKGSMVDTGVYKKFSDELKEELNISGSSPEFIAQLIPEYLEIIFKNKSLGELLAFQEHLDHDLGQAYDESRPELIRNLHKSRALQKIMLTLGLHGLKHIQSMHPKHANSWAAEAILTAQCDLPAISVKAMEGLLEQGFREQGTFSYADHIPELFKIKWVKAGSVGNTAEMEFRETPNAKPREIIAKVIRPGASGMFRNDGHNLHQAVAVLVTKKRATPQEAASFLMLSEKKLEEELRETNTNLENIHLAKEPYYQGEGIKTVSGLLDLVEKSRGIVFMEKAQGTELAKYLKRIRRVLADPELTAQERDLCLEQLFMIRGKYSQLAQIHLGRVKKNLPVHADLHPGNLFYDAEENLLSVLDLGAIAQPVSPESHLQMQRFLFYMYSSVATSDTHYLQMYYKKYHNETDVVSNKIKSSDVEEMLNKIQMTLNQIKERSCTESFVNTEKSMGEVLNIIAQTALTQCPGVIPHALVTLYRSNRLLAEELAKLDQDLALSDFALKIPYGERTQIAMAIKSALTERTKGQFSQLWDKEVLDYFVRHTLPKIGQFEKKFIYGIFWTNDKEAAIILSLLLLASIAAFKAMRFSWKTAKTTVTKLPELIESFKMVDWMSKMGISRKEFFDKLHGPWKKFSEMDFKKSAKDTFHHGMTKCRTVLYGQSYQSKKFSTPTPPSSTPYQTTFYRYRFLPKISPITATSRCGLFANQGKKVILPLAAAGALTYGIYKFCVPDVPKMRCKS